MDLYRSSVKFCLSEQFVDAYRYKSPPFGFNGLGYLVYMRTYSRVKPDGTKEQWWETVRRVVEGTFSLQKRWIVANHLGWDDGKAQLSAQEMYDRMFNMKFLPPGRGLWAMGSSLIEERGLAASLNNCGYVSTKDLASDPLGPFTFMMDAVMLGVGVGFDTRGAGSIDIHRPEEGNFNFVIQDSREGWVESTKVLLSSYFFEGRSLPSFDYTNIRPAGAPVKGFGGTAAGPEGLRRSHQMICRRIDQFLEDSGSKPITETLIVDLMNIIGMGVVSGGVRRSALISLGTTSDEYMDLKNYEVNPERAEFGWTSNNSIFGSLGQSYKEVAKRIRMNGEPGIVWLENARTRGRMKDYDSRDATVLGVNPCAEQLLNSYELCVLVETFPDHHDSREDFLRTLKYAYLYAKTVTLCPTHWTETNRVMLKNRRIGCSISGIAQFVANRSVHTLVDWCEAGYKYLKDLDQIYSDWLAVPRSVRLTTTKPSGSVSLLAGATPGVHFPESRFYIRRVRLAAHSELIEPLYRAGYKIEPASEDQQAVVVEVPVDAGEGVRAVSEVSMWEQLSITAMLQEHWSDNAVSCTVSFDPKTEGDQIEYALSHFQYRLKTVSFLPRVENGAYAQMPYEAITEEQYKEMISRISPLDLSDCTEEAESERYCSGDTCQITAGG